MEEKFIIAKDIRIDYFHRVPNHKSKCRNPHSHLGLIRAVVEGTPVKLEGVSEQDMLIDYSDLKQIMTTELHDRFDHGSIIYEKDIYYDMFKKMQDDGLKVTFVSFIPTAEALSQYFFKLIEPKIKAKFGNELKLVAIEFYETPTSYARYEVKE